MREPNAIDFWRGFVLITIFINHVPGNAFERFTFSRYSVSDAAELFVFLAGWSLALATERRRTPDPAGRVVLRLTSRAVEVYGVQIVIIVLAIAMIAAAALYLENPLLLEWHNAGLFFADPIQATIGLVLLTYQLGYFNILPLYVVLLALAPIFVLVARVSRWTALAISFGLYATSLIFEINLPNWPAEGHWFFNPLAWQFLFVLGFLGASCAREQPFRDRVRRLMPLGIVGVAASFVIAVWDLKPDPLQVPEPRLFFIFSKTYLSPGRLLGFIAILLAFQGLYPIVARHVRALIGPLSALGRNSLPVFAVGSVLALLAQLIRAALPRSVFVDFFLVCSGILGLIFTAWFVEWRSRTPGPSLSD